MNVSPTDARYQLAVRTAAVAGVFSLLICALLLYDFSRRALKDPLEDVQLKALKSALAVQPDNQDLRNQIQTLDEQLRDEYFRQRTFSAIGAALLLGGVAIALIAARAAATLRRKLPQPAPQTAPQDPEIATTQWARWAVVVFAVVLIGGAAGWGLASRTSLPGTEAELTALLESPAPDSARKPRAPVKPVAKRAAKPATAGKTERPTKEFERPPRESAKFISESERPIRPSKEFERPEPELDPTSNKVEKPKPEQGTTTQAAPSEEEIARNWPRFRGPGGLGISAYTNVPTTWNAAKGENILWKSPVPLPGNNSPVVWGDRIFLSGATAKRREVFCFDALRGTLLWQKEVPGTPESTAKPPKIMKDTGFAAPTTTTDGRRVFAIFANGDIAAFAFDGTLAWARSLGMPANSYGHASSLTMYKNLVLVQLDQGMLKERKSKFFALDAASGKTVWEITREVPNSWTTPIVIHAAGRDQLITVAAPWVIAYNPADGKEEIWRANSLRQDVGPSPTFCDGVVYAVNDLSRLFAIRADGKGDVTATHILWKGEDNLPDTCSPLATKEHVFILTSEGMLTCYHAKKGDKLWEHDFEGSHFASSPSQVGNRIYLVSDKGKSFVIEPNQEDCKIVGEGDLGEECVTSPAFQDGRIYLRGYVEAEPDEKADGSEPQREDHLFCIGKK